MKTITVLSFILRLTAATGQQHPMQAQAPLDFVQQLLKEPDTPPGSFLSMLDSNKICDNKTTVMLSIPGLGSLTYDDGKAYIRNASATGIPTQWTISALTNYPGRYAVYHENPFGKQYFLYDNGGHLSTTTSSSSAGRYFVRYTSDSKKPSMVFSVSDYCLAVYPRDDKVYLKNNSPCTPLSFKKVEATSVGSDGDGLGVKPPTHWYDPSDENPTCPNTLKKYMDKYEKGEMNEVMAMSRDDMRAAGWPENLGNFVMGLPLSIVAAAACGVACGLDSVHCVPCTGQGGIV